MSGADRQPAVRDVSPANGGQAVSDERMRQEAFERHKQEAITVTQNGGIDLTPGTYLNMTRPSPWGNGLPGDHPSIPLPPPGDNRPVPPVPGLPNPGDVLHSNPAMETYSSKIGREALVLGGGVGQSFFYGIANLPDHIPQITSGVLIGGTLGAIAKQGKIGAAAAIVIGAYFTSRFVLDTINDGKRWRKFGDAVEDTWHSSDNFWKNMHTVRDTAGNYTFDTSLSMASSYVGYKNPQLGEWILGLLRVPPIVPAATPPFSPAVTAAGFAMDIMPPSGFYREYDDKTPFAPSSWTFDIHGSLRRTPGIITRTPDLLHDRDRDRQDDGDRDRDDRGRR